MYNKGVEFYSSVSQSGSIWKLWPQISFWEYTALSPQNTRRYVHYLFSVLCPIGCFRNAESALCPFWVDITPTLHWPYGTSPQYTDGARLEQILGFVASSSREISLLVELSVTKNLPIHHNWIMNYVESKEIYYFLALNGQKPTGKLYDAYCNYRRLLALSGLIKRIQKTSVISSSDISETESKVFYEVN